MEEHWAGGRCYGKTVLNADISKAQAMARECMSSDYKKCGY
jgi:hypothetical protein|tara:strand:- start:110 stop:232 length:123 start_codon:yes stop_codon:yes gene_type:complete